MNKPEEKMKIMVGMGTIDDYPDYVAAGADEIFIGYVPFSWIQKYGTRLPLNRREVLYYNVQIGSYSELLILQSMVEEYHIPVTITLNSLSYPRESYQDIIMIMQECMRTGFDRFIIADWHFLEYIKEYRSTYSDFYPQIIISGEYGEMNESLIRLFAENGVKRVIFPRQTSLYEMKAMIDQNPTLEYEAFVLNEKCHYTGAYCNSLHCDELCHMCKIPYQFGDQKLSDVDNCNEEFYGTGETGCCFCSLWKMRKAGITHLKVVSRGNSGKATAEDIKHLKIALQILEESDMEENYVKEMKKVLFPDGCSGNCYY